LAGDGLLDRRMSQRTLFASAAERPRERFRDHDSRLVAHHGVRAGVERDADKLDRVAGAIRWDLPSPAASLPRQMTSFGRGGAAVRHERRSGFLRGVALSAPKTRARRSAPVPFASCVFT